MARRRSQRRRVEQGPFATTGDGRRLLSAPQNFLSILTFLFQQVCLTRTSSIIWMNGITHFRYALSTMRFEKRRAFFLLLLALWGLPLAAQDVNQQALPEKTRILFVLDGSGSMNADWGENQSRMDAAKAILT